MNSKTEEEVLKRRGKTSPRSSKIYRRVIPLGGVVILFLAIGAGSRMASKLVVAIMGAALLIFFWVKYLQPKKEGVAKVDLKEMPPKLEGIEVPQQEILPNSEEKAVGIQEGFPEEKKAADFQEKIPEEQEKVFEPHVGFPKEEEQVAELQEKIAEEQGKVVEPQVVFAKEENRVAKLQEFPAQEKIIAIQEAILRLEEKVANLQERQINWEEKTADIDAALLKLEEKTNDMYGMLQKSEEKVDLQMILSKFDEKAEKTI